jgi:hypothetical protein
MTKVTKTEKILRKASSKWSKFLAEGAFKKTLKEFDSDDTYHFDVDKSDYKYSAAEKFKKGDKIKVRSVKKGYATGGIEPEPENVRCKTGTVKGFDGERLIVMLDNGETASINGRNASNKEFQWDNEVMFSCPEEQVNEMTMGERGMVDAQDGNPPSKIGHGNEEYMAAFNAVMQKMGKEPLPIVKPDQAYLDALRSGQLEEQEKEADPRVVAMQQAMDLLGDLQFDSLESALDNMNTEVVRKLGIMLKQLDYNRNQVGNIQENEKKSFKVGEFVYVVNGSRLCC